MEESVRREEEDDQRKNKYKISNGIKMRWDRSTENK